MELDGSPEEYAEEATPEEVHVERFSSYGESSSLRDGEDIERTGFALIEDRSYCIAHFLQTDSGTDISIDEDEPEVSLYRDLEFEYDPGIGEKLEG